MTYKVLFLIFIVIGSATTLGAVIRFSDAMILGMVFPNMIGLFFLFPKVKKELNRYISAIKSEEEEEKRSRIRRLARKWLLGGR